MSFESLFMDQLLVFPDKVSMEFKFELFSGHIIDFIRLSSRKALISIALSDKMYYHPKIWLQQHQSNFLVIEWETSLGF